MSTLDKQKTVNIACFELDSVIAKEELEKQCFLWT